jgi:hypothetical protein
LIGDFSNITITSSANDVRLSGITVSFGSAPKGGGIHNSGTLLVTNSVISDNSATSAANQRFLQGGGIFNAFSATLTISDSVIERNEVFGFNNVNTTSYHGAGVYSLGPTTVTNTIFAGNLICDSGCFPSSQGEADSRGAGLYKAGVGTLIVTNSTFESNVATAVDPGLAEFRAEGGAMFARPPEGEPPAGEPAWIQIFASTFSENTAKSNRGIVDNSSERLTIVGGGLAFSENVPSINTQKPEVQIINATIAQNKANLRLDKDSAVCFGLGIGECRVGAGGIWYNHI